MSSRLSRAMGAALLAALAACGGTDLAAPTGVPASDVAVPPLMGGLKVGYEKKASKEFNKHVKTLFGKEGGARPYIADGVAYSLREGKELKAVFEIARLTSDADPTDTEFRRKIVDQIGSGTPSPRCGAALTDPPCDVAVPLVYPREGTQQVFYVWFRDRHMYVLMIRQDDRSGPPPDPLAILSDALESVG